MSHEQTAHILTVVEANKCIDIFVTKITEF